ncbi:class I SAM-dependent rRNA methyltransferase [Pseudobacteriovorax antillogorgiicola]|uniref:23S rRNA (Cytosine1962-C5)-methyltransferase n=1 Tax=Pseudobacteriovorax antillogorgiicola TaxID=1513793 RepID=A0A1Y6CP13_9BACT|nr:class I SAM-dependent rRNA methyltransferase [Pseudobacteriovorax antillogorgiicola]TCS44577.1 23S rRNA (cytosine1962-C5)-methyltransferase [Pseudobacteriovorax antillogorgiicola]SMF77991.1 23S rRNA (cytosine1962-C5)-methyltransferase [Pseudobacteriovorax antillogorgiicola]
MAKVHLKPGKEKSLINHHPWVFSGALQTAPKSLASGDDVSVHSAKGQFLGRGYYNPHSQIRVRIYSWQDGVSLNADFLREQIKSSIERRKHIDRQETNCIRLVAHDADYLPGLVIDQFDQWVSFQILTAGMEKHRDTIIALILELLNPQGIVERSDEAVRKKEGLELRKEVILGELPKEGVTVLENGMKLLVDLWEGHKTGFYIDQRDNRAIIKHYSEGSRVLNCFSYTGGFSVAAALGGAHEVTSIDESEPALELAQESFEKNGLSIPHHTIHKDVFKYLRELRDAGEQFDFIILDPPKFAASHRNIQGACRGYKDLNLLAFQLLRPGGLLASFSCSGLISRDLFQKVVFGATIDAGCDAQIVKHLSQSEDHPTRLSFPESLYLKGLLLRKV